jgi:Fe-S-cluster containining protein
MSFGAFITIERQLNDRDYYCRYGIKNELFLAHVDTEYVDELSDEFARVTAERSAHLQKKCPFMRRNHSGNGFACAIHPSRPQVCSEFRCYRMLIYDKGGQLCGRVIGHNDIKTSDESLAHLWKENVSHLHYAHSSRANDPVWVRKVLAVLAANGYRGDPVE